MLGGRQAGKQASWLAGRLGDDRKPIGGRMKKFREGECVKVMGQTHTHTQC